LNVFLSKGINSVFAALELSNLSLKVLNIKLLALAESALRLAILLRALCVVQRTALATKFKTLTGTRTSGGVANGRDDRVSSLANDLRWAMNLLLSLGLGRSLGFGLGLSLLSLGDSKSGMISVESRVVTIPVLGLAKRGIDGSVRVDKILVFRVHSLDAGPGIVVSVNSHFLDDELVPEDENFFCSLVFFVLMSFATNRWWYMTNPVQFPVLVLLRNHDQIRELPKNAYDRLRLWDLMTW
jgi:hypothetical protein